MKILNVIVHWFKNLNSRQKLLVLFAISLSPVAIDQLANQDTPQPRETSPSDSIDTLIPNGSVLIPIEVENSDSLDSILGNKGIVDLHRPAREPGRNRIVARRLPILRAPLNPHQFAVLAPEDQAHHIVKQPGPFWVVIQNPTKFGTNFERPTKKIKKNRTIFEGGVE